MNWYCIHTKSQKESFAARYCQGVLGLETYLPMLVRRKVVRRVKRTVVSPLFPHYFFCRFDLTTHYRAVRYGPDVAHVVQSGGSPTLVSEGLISQIRTLESQAEAGLMSEPELKPGELVLITGGVMSGLQAVFVRDMSDRERVEILLSVLDCGAKLVIGRDEIRRVS